MSVGEKNAYWCQACGGYVVTVDADEGVTPMFLACRVKGDPKSPENDCRGSMVSMMYPKDPWPECDRFGVSIPTTPAWEWYRPRAWEQLTLPSQTREHVRKGGLLLRAIRSQ